MFSKRSVDIGVNWVSWLQDQAARHFVWDEQGQYYRVRAERGTTYPDLRTAWDNIGRHQPDFPNIHNNLFADRVQFLSRMLAARIAQFFSKQELTDFELLDHGGRALAYRARHIPTGQMRIARMEASHNGRCLRPAHPVVLPPFASNEDDLKRYADFKLEIMPEIMPLSKILRACDVHKDSILSDHFYRAVNGLSWGTNLMYPQDMFDRDAELQNVGVRPDGKIVTLDPEIVTGPRAILKHRHFITPGIVKDASAQQLALIYST